MAYGIIHVIHIICLDICIRIGLADKLVSIIIVTARPNRNHKIDFAIESH